MFPFSPICLPWSGWVSSKHGPCLSPEWEWARQKLCLVCDPPWRSHSVIWAVFPLSYRSALLCWRIFGDTSRLTTASSYFSNLHLLDQSPIAGHLHGFHSCYCMEQASGACCYTSVPSVFGFTLSGSQSHLKPYSKLGPLWTTPFKHWQDDGLLRGLPR